MSLTVSGQGNLDVQAILDFLRSHDISLTRCAWQWTFFECRYAIAAKPVYEHTLQLVVSTAQLYGDIVYFATVVLKGVEICSPGPVYFWFYYIFMNGIWVVIPLLITFRSWLAINGAFARSKKKTA